ncbi:unnamed protein product [Linum trigynum]|uniref:Uncharacterized protein n=1 Tax=Linum trigynum TaxID=586398 RepID=A0AAV2CGQ0_9ROSI
MAGSQQHAASVRLAQVAIFNGKGFEDAAGAFLPRSHGLHTLYPSDLWILASAKENRVISYPHLMFDHMLNYHDANYDGELPFAPQITQILLALGLDLRFKVARVDILSSLQAQFVLRKVDTSVERRRPLVNAPGGEAAGHAVPPHEDGLSLADLGEDDSREAQESFNRAGMIRDNGKQPLVHPLDVIQEMLRQEGEASSSRNQMQEDEDGISDYVSSPDYEF